MIFDFFGTDIIIDKVQAVTKPHYTTEFRCAGAMWFTILFKGECKWKEIRIYCDINGDREKDTKILSDKFNEFKKLL
jgi:hypothetical protein